MPYNGHLTLAWAANPEPDLAGYRIYVGSAPGVYDPARTLTTTGLTQVVSGLDNGVTWYMAVTALDTSDNESAYSEEVNRLLTVPLTRLLRRVA